MVPPAGSGRSVSGASVGTLGAVRPCDKTCWVEGTLTRAAGDGAVTAPTTCNPSGQQPGWQAHGTLRPVTGPTSDLGQARRVVHRRRTSGPPQQRTSLDRPGWSVTLPR